MNNAITEIYGMSIDNFLVKESLDHGNYVLGYTASLLYVMNGLAIAVLVKDPLSRKKQELLKKNCNVASIPCFYGKFVEELINNHSTIPSDIDVITVLSE
ncbi:MAG: hypothetical protein EAX86_03285 [Candidatus Heimdallarchaeota archaeon]|nr:hypothetical protein [Candidatus Heimdallarchaeota archaeon]